MARITVEDCLSRVANRFELVLIATKRARQLAMSAAEPTVPWQNDKPTVVALREIAHGYVTAETLIEGDKMAAQAAQQQQQQLHQHPSHEIDPMV